MKKLTLLLLLAITTLFAEPTFDQIQTFIDKQDYKQAKFALSIITQNHPDSAKAYYSLAQANAGLGDLVAAKEALQKAQALNPNLNFVPTAQVEQLKKAIQPQANLITKVEEPSHWFRNLFILLIIGLLGFFGFKKYKQKKAVATPESVKPTEPTPTPAEQPKSEPSIKRETLYRDEPTHYSSTSQTGTTTHPSNVTEVHHHHHNSGNNTLETVVTAAAVSSLMNNGHHNESSSHVTHNTYNTYVEPKHEETRSNSWEDKPSKTWDEPKEEQISKTWDEPVTPKSNSWSDSSSSSSSDSWSSSSSNSGSDSWE